MLHLPTKPSWSLLQGEVVVVRWCVADSFPCRISFVGGKQLNTTGNGFKEAEVKVYPTPSASTHTPVVGTATKTGAKPSFAAKPSIAAKPSVATTPGVAAKPSIPVTPSITAAATTSTPGKPADPEPEPVGELGQCINTP